MDYCTKTMADWMHPINVIFCLMRPLINFSSKVKLVRGKRFLGENKHTSGAGYINYFNNSCE